MNYLLLLIILIYKEISKNNNFVECLIELLVDNENICVFKLLFFFFQEKGY